MKKTTVLARMRYSIKFTSDMLSWLDDRPKDWFARNGGDDFLHEYGGQWIGIIAAESEAVVSSYFENLGVPRENLPYFQSGESYKGSWIFDATVLMTGTIGSSYMILKGLSELPQIAKGLSELRKDLETRIKPAVNKRILQILDQLAARSRGRAEGEEAHSPPPTSPATVDLVIDARPVVALSPDSAKSHKLALSVAISRSAISIENLGEEDMSDVRVGLFRTSHERNQWSFSDAYAGTFSIISSGQIYLKKLGDFVDNNGSKLDLSDDAEAFVDCWIQDGAGIYLFRFFLEAQE